MDSFLARVAQAYYNEHKADIRQFTFVFPNQRAGLFFRYYLSKIISKPIFSPEVISISDCFASLSQWQQSDKMSDLFRLYRIYRDISKSDETFDSFVFWGEMLLSDFDDVDKYLVDARQLFTNISDLKEIDNVFDVFTEKQIEVIRHFWSNFVPVTEGKTKEEFIATWKILLPLYERFHSELLSENLATQGMIYRHVVEVLKSNNEIEQWKNKQFIFVGFNALNPCEKQLFLELQKRKKADFYFDYESEELRDPDNQASRFYRENTRLFPSNLTIEASIYSLTKKEIELIAVPSAIGQTKHIHSILNNIFPPNGDLKDEIKTAIVLPDENLLTPLLHSFPPHINRVNITMGFPLKSTPIFALIEHIIELQKRARAGNSSLTFYHKNVSGIIHHQYITFLCKDDCQAIDRHIKGFNRIYVETNILAKNDLLKAVFASPSNSLEFVDYLSNIVQRLQSAWQAKGNVDSRITSDFLYSCYIGLNRLKDIMTTESRDIDISLDTLYRMIRQLMSGITIPFEGEPLSGLQVMGMLETRGLDFENLIIPSFNEGSLPKRNNTNSFIPYSLRKCFELPVPDYHDAITSYNFYRLIHRAKRVFFLYDSRTEGLQTGEVSRFMHQLHYHYGVPFKQKTLSFDLIFSDTQHLSITKTPEVMQKLLRFTGSDGEKPPALSATSLNTYIDCPLKFYFSQVEGIQEESEVQETIEEGMFGTLFHAAMENLYKPFLGKTIEKSSMDSLLENDYIIDKEIVRAFSHRYFQRKEIDREELDGNNLLIANIIRKYVKQVIKRDKEKTPFDYVASELACQMPYAINNGSLKVNLKGFIDRVEQKNGISYVLDYKTGRGSLQFKNLEEVFEHNNEKRPKFVLQTFLYVLLYKAKSKENNVLPAILYLRSIFEKDFSTELVCKSDNKTNLAVNDFSLFEPEFKKYLSICLEEIFNPDIPFEQTSCLSICQYCPYAFICKR